MASRSMPSSFNFARSSGVMSLPMPRTNSPSMDCDHQSFSAMADVLSNLSFSALDDGVWSRAMRVTCEQCRLEYELQDDRVPPGGAQVQCTHCSHVFLVRNPALLDTLVLTRSENDL